MDDNVISFPGAEIIEDDPMDGQIDVDAVLEAVRERGLSDIIIIGTYEDKDNFYFSSTSPDLAKLNWDLDRAKKVILEIAFDNDPLVD